MSQTSHIIPKGWERERFNTRISLEYGSSLPESKRADGTFPVFGSNGQVGSHSEALIKGPGIIVGRKGTIGAVTWSQNDFWPIDTTYYIKHAPSLNLRWVYYKLQSLGLTKMNTASGTPGLNREEVYKLMVDFPSEKEQEKIAEILTTIDSEIEKTNEVIAATEKLKRGLMQNLFTPSIGVTKLKDVTELITKGTTPTTYGHEFIDKGINFFKIENIDEGGHIDLGTCKHISEKTHSFLKRSQLMDGDVLFSIAGALGRVAVINKSHLPANTNQAIAIVRPKNQDDSLFLSQVLRTDHVKTQVVGSSVQLAQANISLGKLGEISIPWPDAKERNRISKIIMTVEEKVIVNKKIKTNLLLLKRGLMRDLLTGNKRTV